jgi:hypothetical protein
MHKPHDQAEFFRLLAKVFYYMVSGKSHIGYLCNNIGNPLSLKPVRPSCQVELMVLGDESIWLYCGESIVKKEFGGEFRGGLGWGIRYIRARKYGNWFMRY